MIFFIVCKKGGGGQGGMWLKGCFVFQKYMGTGRGVVSAQFGIHYAGHFNTDTSDCSLVGSLFGSENVDDKETMGGHSLMTSLINVPHGEKNSANADWLPKIAI